MNPKATKKQSKVGTNGILGCLVSGLGELSSGQPGSHMDPGLACLGPGPRRMDKDSNLS